jgi:hypothetical protein
MLARRLLVIMRLNVASGRKPFSTSTRTEQIARVTPKSRLGAKRRRSVGLPGGRIVRQVSRLASHAGSKPLAEIIVLRPERAHFADFDTRLARACGTA